MKVVKGFKLRPLGNEFVLIGEDMKLVDFNKIISFNSTAAYLWESVQEGEFTVRDLAKLLTDKYEVTDEQALSDSEKIAREWMEAGVIEE